MEIFSHRFNSAIPSIDAAETVVIDFARLAGFTTKARARIGLAVREIVANAVIHGNRYDVSKKVLLEVRRSETQMAIVVSDEGSGFDPNRVADPVSPEGLFRSSGRGLLLARTLMDEIHVGAGVNGTRITLVKYIRWSAAQQTRVAPREASLPH
jgi:serine/threonine-protein kinase RsbW